MAKKSPTATPIEVIEKVRTAYREQKLSEVLGSFAEDAHVIGTKAGESWTGRGGLERSLTWDFGLPKMRGQIVDPDREIPEVHVEGAMAWAAVEGRFDFGAGSHFGRWTCILSKLSGEWKIVHSHFSVPEGVKTP